MASDRAAADQAGLVIWIAGMVSLTSVIRISAHLLP
jgi:hypothetical protein